MGNEPADHEFARPPGYLGLVLHAHLPYVRHPEHADVLEEDWLFEAITETYLPLFEKFEGWTRDGLPWRLTMSVSPPLAAMLGDALLKTRYRRYLDNLLQLVEKERNRVKWEAGARRVVEMYSERLLNCRDAFRTKWHGDVLNGFRKYADDGHLELITCSATHAFLPLMLNEKWVAAQIEIGCREFERSFGRRPAGIWLPECGYAPGLEVPLEAAGLRYFFVDSHGVVDAEPRPRYGVFAPVVLPRSNLVAVGRDVETARQVWCPVEGYPGDPWYREFHRDIGFQLEEDYLKPHLHSAGVRHFTGLKYQRVTGRTEEKALYEPDRARERVEEHARHFVESRRRQVGWLAEVMPERPPLIAAPFDAELFGHWWFEGPDWLDRVMRLTCATDSPVRPTTVPDYLLAQPTVQICRPAFSSWGEGGYCGIWLNETNDWIYPPLHRLADWFVDLADRLEIPDRDRERAMNQAARELLLAQSSDWAFIMKMGTVADYAVQRTQAHIENASELLQQVEGHRVDVEKLEILEHRNPIFADINYRMFRTD